MLSYKSIPYNEKGNIGGEEGAGAESIFEVNLEVLVKNNDQRCKFTERKIDLQSRLSTSLAFSSELLIILDSLLIMSLSFNCGLRI